MYDFEMWDLHKLQMLLPSSNTQQICCTFFALSGAGLCWLLIVDSLTEGNLNYCWCKKNILACYIGIHMTCYCVYATYSGLQCCHLCCVCSFQCLFVFMSQNINC